MKKRIVSLIVFCFYFSCISSTTLAFANVVETAKENVNNESTEYSLGGYEEQQSILKADNEDNDSIIVVPIDEEPKNFDCINDTWSFSNLTDYISIDKFQKYLDPASALIIQEKIDDGTKGHCFGMSITSAAAWDNYPRINSFGNHNKLNEVGLMELSSELNYTAHDFIDYGHVFQYTDYVQREVHKNINDYDGLYDAISKFEETAPPDKSPVIIPGTANTAVLIGIFDGEGRGHYILGLKIAEITSNEVKIRVYDCNNPSEKCYLSLYREGNKKFTGWHYDGGLNWGSNSGGYISYSMPTSGFVLNKYTYKAMLYAKNQSQDTTLDYGDIFVPKDENEFFFSDFITPINPANGIKTNSYKTYWFSGDKPLEFSNLSAKSEVGIAKDDIAVSASIETGGSVSLDLDSFSTDVTPEKSGLVKVTYDFCEGYNKSKEIIVEGRTGEELISACKENGDVILNGMSNCNVIYNERYINQNGHTEKTVMSQLNIDDLDKNGKYCVRIVDSGKKYIEILQDLNNDGAYENVVADSNKNSTVELFSYEVNENVKLENSILVYGDFAVKNNKKIDLNGYSITVLGNASIQGDVDLNHGKLIINGDVVHTSGTVSFNKGTLKIGGNYTKKFDNSNIMWSTDCSLSMKDENDILEIYGKTNSIIDVSGYIAKPNDVFLNGSIFFYDDVLNWTSVNSKENKSLVTIVGDKHIMNGDFGIVSINGDSIVVQKSFSALQMNTNIHISCEDNIKIDIYDLNRKNLRVDGNIEQSLVNLNRGYAFFSGNVNNTNLINGSAEIKGNYSGSIETTLSENIISIDGKADLKNSKLQSGKLILKGDISLSSGMTKASAEHLTIIDGEGEQRISLQKTFENIASFGKLRINNQNSVFNEMSFLSLESDAQCKANNADVRGINLNGHNLTINGDVNIVGSNDINKGTLSIYGDVKCSDNNGHSVNMDIHSGEVNIYGNLYHNAGTININCGKLYIDKNYENENYTYLKMENDDDQLTIHGDTYIKSSLIGLNWKAGTTYFHGDLIENSDINEEEIKKGGEYGGGIHCDKEHISIFNGTRKQIISLLLTKSYLGGDSDVSWLGTVKFSNSNIQIDGIGLSALGCDARIYSNNGTIWSPSSSYTMDGHDSKLSDFSLNGCILDIDGNVTFMGRIHFDSGSISINGDVDVNCDLFLDGMSLNVDGNLTHEGGKVYLEKGKIIVNRNYSARNTEYNKARLFMSDDEDYFFVGQEFNVYEYNVPKLNLSAGIVELFGNINIDASSYGTVYHPFTGSNRVILSGENHQNIRFNYGDNIGTYFNELQLTRDISNYSFSPNPCWNTLIEFSDENIPIDKIILNRNVLSINQGEIKQLIAKIVPGNATNSQITWSSDDNSIATVDESGYVKGVGTGSTTITAKTNNGKIATCEVTVTDKKVIPVESISVTPNTKSIGVNETIHITATVLPEDATDKSVTWSSSKPSVATVDKEGKVTGLAEGKTIISAKAADKSAVCVVMVSDNKVNPRSESGLDPQIIKVVDVDDPKVTSYTAELVKGQKYTLGGGLWSTSNPQTVTVNKKSGVVTAKKTGIATIRNSATNSVYYMTVFEPVISAKTASVFVGSSVRVSIKNTGDMPVTWMSADIHKVYAIRDSKDDAKGIITGVSKGKTKVYAYVNGKAYPITVNVVDQAGTKKLSNYDSIRINAFQTYSLQYPRGVFKPSKVISWADTAGLSWRRDINGNWTDLSQAVTITKSGKVIGNTATDGKPIIVRGTDVNGNNVTLEINVEAIPVRTDIYMNVGQTASLKHSFVRNIQRLRWDYDNNYIGIVDPGKVKAKIKGVAVGEETVSCRYQDVIYNTFVHVENPAVVTDSRMRQPKPSAYNYTLALSKGETYDIGMSGVFQDVLWKSNNNSRAFVDEYGRITARGVGKANLTTKVNGRKLKISVVVTE